MSWISIHARIPMINRNGGRGTNAYDSGHCHRQINESCRLCSLCVEVIITTIMSERVFLLRQLRSNLFEYIDPNGIDLASVRRYRICCLRLRTFFASSKDCFDVIVLSEYSFNSSFLARMVSISSCFAESSVPWSSNSAVKTTVDVFAQSSIAVSDHQDGSLTDRPLAVENRISAHAAEASWI